MGAYELNGLYNTTEHSEYFVENQFAFFSDGIDIHALFYLHVPNQMPIPPEFSDVMVVLNSYFPKYKMIDRFVILIFQIVSLFTLIASIVFVIIRVIIRIIKYVVHYVRYGGNNYG